MQDPSGEDRQAQRDEHAVAGQQLPLEGFIAGGDLDDLVVERRAWAAGDEAGVGRRIGRVLALQVVAPIQRSGRRPRLADGGTKITCL